MNRQNVELNSNNVIPGVIWRLSSRLTVKWDEICKMRICQNCPKVIRGVELNRKNVELNSNNVIAGVIWRLSSRLTVKWDEILKMRIFQNCPQSHQRSRNEPQKRRIELQYRDRRRYLKALIAYNGKLRRNLQNENFSKLPKSSEESKWTAETSNWTPITRSQALFDGSHRV